MSELTHLSARELKLTAAVYVLLGAAKHLRKTGRLPKTLGGAWTVIPMRLVVQKRGPDLALNKR